MRTTVTLDPDVDAMLKNVMRERGISFKEALNQAARRGLRGAPRRPAKFVQKTFRMGAERYFPWEKALAVSDAMEDEEILRKLSLRK